MTFKDAYDKLQEIFISRKFEILDQTDTSFKIKRRFLLNASITEEDIKSYQTAEIKRSKYENKPFETSILSLDYREQQIQFLHPTKTRLFLFPKDTDIVFGTENADEVYVKIGKATDLYIWLNLENEKFWSYSLQRNSIRSRLEDVSFKEAIGRPFTIQIYNINESSIENSINHSSKILDACIFTFSSLKNNPIGLLESWPKRIQDENFEYYEIQRSNNFSLPHVTFNPHLIKFYQLASSTDFESHKFLSYYHILEYHFLSVSDQLLYDKLSRRINDLRFRTNSNNLDRIIQDVNSHRTENDETEMLKNVLNKYIAEDEVIDFIKVYEEAINDNIYTKKRIIFGTEISGTNLSSGHVFGIIAKHIKTIRNALVHSSDRHERNDRYIPYLTKSMEIVKKEIPLLKFIAEKIIIATAE